MTMEAGIRLRLEPRDEYPHPVEAAENFNESVYANIFDASHGPMGAWLRVGNRPNEGRAEVTCCVYLPDGRVGFSYARPEISGNEAFDSGGLTFQVLEPFKSMRTTFRGSVCLLEDPLAMADPRKAFQGNPVVDCLVDILYTGISPMYGGEKVGEDGSPVQEKPEEAFARAHYEQHMSGKGIIAVGGREWRIDGFGLRDHSWGPRYWQNISWYRWLPMCFGPDFGMMISIVQLASGRREIGGMVLRNGLYEYVQDARVVAKYDRSQYQTDLKAWARTPHGEYEVEGRVLSLLPLRNQRKKPDGGLLCTRITEGMTEYRCMGMTGYGMSEFLDQIVDGQPAGMD